MSCGKDEPAIVDNDFTEMPVASIELDASMDMFEVKALHYEGTFTSSDGEAASTDLDLSKSGDCSGTITTSGGTAEILVVDSEAYLRGDERFWRAAGAGSDKVAALTGGNWLHSKEANESLTKACDLTDVLAVLYEHDSDAKGALAEVNGVPAVELIGEEDGTTTHTWVAIDYPHYLLKVDEEGGHAPSTLTFSEFDKELNLTAPAADEIAIWVSDPLPQVAHCDLMVASHSRKAFHAHSAPQHDLRRRPRPWPRPHSRRLWQGQ